MRMFAEQRNGDGKPFIKRQTPEKGVCFFHDSKF